MQNPFPISLVIFAVLVAVFVIFPVPVHSQVLPFIVDEIVTEDVRSESSDIGSDSDSGSVPGDLQRICAFKLSNPDTLPFYLLVSFKEGGKMVHTSHETGVAAMRLVNLELRYNNERSMPVVKVFPGSEFDENLLPRRRVGGAWAGGSRTPRFGKKKNRAAEGGEVVSSRGYRAWVYEIPFLPEDAQASYEMEVWGALMVRKADGRVVAGRYMETISIDIEGMGESAERVRDGALTRRRKK